MSGRKSLLPGIFLLVLTGLLPVTVCNADTRYYQRVFFDNSLTPDRYFESSGKASVPSSLNLREGKLPVDTQSFLTGPNALQLEWMSRRGGSWEAEVRVQEWRNREIYFPGTVLYFWCYSAMAVAAAQLPHLVLRDRDRNFTAPLDLAVNVQNIPTRKWVRVKIPLDRFSTASIRSFQPHRVSTLVFVQGEADETKHTLLVDEIGIDSDHSPTAAAAGMPKVQNLRAKGYERHIDLSWDPIDDKNLGRYVISRSMNGGPCAASASKFQESTVTQISWGD